MMTEYRMISAPTMISTIGQAAAACASCQASAMTTTPTITILAMKIGMVSTTCWYLIRPRRVRTWLRAYPTTATAPMTSVKTS